MLNVTYMYNLALSGHTARSYAPSEEKRFFFSSTRILSFFLTRNIGALFVKVLGEIAISQFFFSLSEDHTGACELLVSLKTIN